MDKVKLPREVAEVLYPQLEIFIQEEIGKDPTGDYFTHYMYNHGWTQVEPWNKEVFRYEHARFTLLQLLNMAELFWGTVATDALETQLKTWIRELVDKHAYDSPDNYLVLHEEHKAEVEKGDAA